MAALLVAGLIAAPVGATVESSSHGVVGNALHGTVSATESGVPLRGIEVRVLDASTRAIVTTTTTQSDGSYSTIDLPSGSYLVRFIDKSKRYKSEFHVDARYAGQATPVAHGAGDTVVDAALDWVPLTAPTLAARIGSGDLHTCMRQFDRTVRCWGQNDHGQLGNGSTGLLHTPALVVGVTRAVAIAAGGEHTCALRRTAPVTCWGRNDGGQLGDGTDADRATPVAVQGLTGAVALTGGDGHTCALIEDGTARCWGWNGTGQLGDGSLNLRQLTPRPVVGLTGIVSISAGTGHTCAVLDDGTAWCWGNGSSGQLGNGLMSVSRQPVQVSGITTAVAIAASWQHSCALLADGTATCWGSNGSGRLGAGTLASSSPTPLVVKNLVGAVSIDTGREHGCALLADGGARCWGRNDWGQVGDGSASPRLSAVGVTALSDAVTISGGVHHTCAAVANGSARCWGNNTFGQLGIGTFGSYSLTPTAVIALS